MNGGPSQDARVLADVIAWLEEAEAKINSQDAVDRRDAIGARLMRALLGE